MSKILIFIIHSIILTTIILMFYYIFKQIFAAATTESKCLRLLSLLSGFIIYLGAKVVGLDISNLILNTYGPAQFVFIKIIKMIFPGFIGCLSGWLFVKSYQKKQDNDQFLHLLILLSSLILVLVSDLYLESWTLPNAKTINPNLFANLCFILGLILYVIFGRNQLGKQTISKKRNWINKV